MDKTILFNKTVKDIRNRLDSYDEYEILMIAGLLRKLIMDGDSLLNQVLRSKKPSVTFKINPLKELPPGLPRPTFHSIEDGFDPETSFFPGPIKEVNRDQLLKAPVMQFMDHVVTVGDLIKHMSHVEGAIHPGSPKNEMEKALKYLGENLGIGGLPAGIRLLKAIARVVLKGLDELEKQTD